MSVILLSLTLISCKPTLKEYKPDSAAVDFSSYLAVGNSLSAGFCNGALYKDRQQYAFPNILAEQLEYVGRKGVFKQPYLDYPDGIRADEVDGKLYLSTRLSLQYVKDCLGQTSLGAGRVDPNAPQDKLYQALSANISDQGPFCNIGVPALKAINMFMPNYGKLNLYFGRMIKNPESETVISLVKKVKPSFFSVLIGNNDVILYAVTGGTSGFVTPVNGAAGVGFDGSFNAIIDTLIANNTNKSGKLQGVLMPVGDIEDLPYFNTIPYNAIPIKEQSQADALNAAYDAYNKLMEQLGIDERISFSVGNNPAIIQDPDLPLDDQYAAYKFRQIKSTEKLLLSLPRDSIVCAGWGTMKPVPDEFTLRQPQIQKIAEAKSGYNEIIKSMAQKYGLAYADINILLGNIKKGRLVIDGVKYSAEFITGNVFSLDGIHLTPQGNALLANFIIEAINKHYGTKIPYTSVTKYPTLIYP
ncbi:MAG: hypothetical protein ACEPOV_03635 [Hyphomicrobiales bacterium]